jgi:hypothetical protein
VDARHAARRWLDSEGRRVLDPALAEALHDRLGASAGPETVAAGRCGTVTVFLPTPQGPRRVIEIDRNGTLVATLRWTGNGLLEGAVRIPDRSWIVIEPGVTTDAPGGRGDRLWWASEPRVGPADAVPLTAATAVDWARIDEIPTVAEPGRLPPGAGTAVLNLIATLALDQGRRALVYRGPFPTEQLFTALLESFRYVPLMDDPLAAFRAGGLAWDPAPHERHFEPDGVVVSLRDRVEKVTWERRTYYRPDWQALTRYAPRRVWDTEDGVRCSLWALGARLDDHLALGPDGALRAVLAVGPESGPTHAIPAEVVRGLVGIVAASSARALAAPIGVVGAPLRAEWGPVDGDLVTIAGDRVRFSDRLRELARTRIAALAEPPARMTVALATLAEAAALIGDELRARAQRAIAAMRPRDQAAALAAGVPSSPAAPEIARAAATLLAELSGRGVDDQPDVERDEERDRHG